MGAALGGASSVQCPNTWKEYLSQFTAKDLLQNIHRKLVRIPVEATLEEALKIMATNHILSAPVWNQNEMLDMGFFDLQDLLAYIEQHFPTWELTPQFFQTPITKLVDISKRNAVITVRMKTPLNEVLQKIVESHVYRIAIVSKHGYIKHIVTQSAVIAFIEFHAGRAIHHPSLTKSVKELHLWTAPVKSIPDTVTAAQGYKTLWDAGRISALAVVNAEGQLVGNLSIGELRNLDSSNYKEVQKPIKEFLAHRNSPPASKMTISVDTTFNQLVQKLRENHLHRVFVLDYADPKFLGIITLTNIISFLATA